MELLSRLFPFVLLVSAMGLCWFLGYRSRFRRIPGFRQNPEQDYFIGINFLLNDEPDDAIDIFIGAMELNSGTLDTHLALCTLLRRRGKVDRAIAHAQQLLASEKFAATEKSAIRLNLARSYVAAGLLDRAERLLEELKQADPATREAALGLAVSLYQKEQEWPQALEAASELLRICPAEKRAELQLQCSHYHCELAEAALQLGNLQMARAELRKALGFTRSNVRIYFLLAHVESSAGDSREAARALQKVAQVDADFAGEACVPQLAALEAAGLHAERNALVTEVLSGKPGLRTLLALIPVMRDQAGLESTQQQLDEQLTANPSLGLLAETLALAAEVSDSQRNVLEQGAEILRQYLQNCPQYRCESCGFELRNLHWQCPGCSKWGLVKPLDRKTPLL